MSAQGVARATALAAAAAAMVWTAHSAPVHTATGERLATTTSPVDAASLVCPGGPGRAKADLAITSLPRAGLPFPSNGGHVQLRMRDARASVVDLPRGESEARSVSGHAVVEASGGLAPGFAAAQFTGGAKAPTSARTCDAPSNEAWIPVGDRAQGRLLTLVLVNAGSHPATVDVDVRAAGGDVGGAVIADRAVPAHGRVELNLPREATAHAAPVVHVRTEGAAVQASVRDTARSGAVQGTEITAQYTAAAPVQVLAAVPITGGATTVRLVAPDDRPAVVRLQALMTDGRPTRDSVVTVAAGRTLDARLTGLSGDAVAVRATSESDIVASALTASSPKGAKDFAWSPATPGVGDAAGLSLTGSRGPGTLVLASDGAEAKATVRIVGKDGDVSTRAVTVPRAGATRLAVPRDAAVWVTASSPGGLSHLHAAVILRAGSGASSALSVAPLVPAPWQREDIAVVQR